MEVDIPFTFEALPDLPLIRIFDFLSGDDIKQACLVIRRWFDLLQLQKFRDKLTFVLRDCCLGKDKAPWNDILVNPMRTYSSFLLGMQVGFSSKAFKQEFLQMIGKSVTTVVLEIVYGRILDEFPWKTALHSLPHLKKIKAANPHILSFFELPNTITEMQFESMRRWTYEGDPIFKSLKRLTNLKVITIQEISSSRSNDTKHTPIRMTDELQKLTLDFNQFGIRRVNILEKEIGFEDILTLYISKSSAELKRWLPALPHMTRLRKLVIAGKGFPSCFFSHTATPCPSVKEIEMKLYSGLLHKKPCEMCWTAFWKTFPNAEAWDLWHGSCMDPGVLRQNAQIVRKFNFCLSRTTPKFTFQFPNLVELDLDCRSRLYAISLDVCAWPVMSRLKKLIINERVKIDDQNFQHLLQACPNVSCTAVLKCRKLSLQELKQVGDCWPEIENLRVNLNVSAEGMLDAFTGRFQRLKILKTRNDQPYPEYTEVFKRLPLLKSFHCIYDNLPNDDDCLKHTRKDFVYMDVKESDDYDSK